MKSQLSALALLLCPLFACNAPEAAAPRFQQDNVIDWAMEQPAGSGTAVGDTWRTSELDLRPLVIDGGVPLHLHAEREEWVYVLWGSGSFRVGPAGGGFVPDASMREIIVRAGDRYLIPRGTAHKFTGRATVLSIFSPPMSATPDRVFP